MKYNFWKSESFNIARRNPIIIILAVIVPCIIAGFLIYAVFIIVPLLNDSMSSALLFRDNIHKYASDYFSENNSYADICNKTNTNFYNEIVSAKSNSSVLYILQLK